MPKHPSVKINDRVWRYLDDDKKYYGTCIRMTDKGVRCKWDDFPLIIYYCNVVQRLW
ncbi:hypothetical protein CAL7716_103130 (plasmid) [Calothrix sp. PCC 7716]|nr:hypothetical protein CAL7716_103130 [Calothrix sp. PCC 7716]